LDETVSGRVSNFPAFMAEFGIIEYLIDDEVRTQELFLGTVSSRRRRLNDLYFFQIFEEISRADSVVLVFNLRNNIYRYYIK
jgi:hypothetical protein